LQFPIIMNGFLTCLTAALLTSVARADYALPVVKERLVVLLDAAAMRVESGPKVFHVVDRKQSFPIDLFFLQDRIASQGLDVGDFSAANARLRELEKVTGGKAAGQVLAEFVLLSKDEKWVVSYLKAFDAVRDFQRYVAAPVRGDRIELKFERAPLDAADFERQLKERSARALRALPGA
jgi:hypothetical protein